MRPGVTQEQQKAVDFFNRYNEEQQTIKQRTESFQNRTKTYFNDDFKGFDFNLGEKKFRYGVKDPSKVAESQSNINNIVGKFLDNEGNVKDPVGYHKAMYAAANVDTIANHFYEQGKADGIKGVITNSKNPAQDGTRQVADGNVFINGLKVKSISGLDSSKLKIKIPLGVLARDSRANTINSRLLSLSRSMKSIFSNRPSHSCFVLFSENGFPLKRA